MIAGVIALKLMNKLDFFSKQNKLHITMEQIIFSAVSSNKKLQIVFLSWETTIVVGFFSLFQNSHVHLCTFVLQELSSEPRV